MRVFIELSYDGTHYHGWQRQPVSYTVQQVIEEALERLCGTKTAIVGCGRTDAEVHASYYVAHCDIPALSEAQRYDSLDQLTFKLNGILNDDVAIKCVTEVSEKAHARFDASDRSYTYLPPSITEVIVDAIATLICPLTLLGKVTTKGVDLDASGCFLSWADPVYPVRFKAEALSFLIVNVASKSTP